MKKYQAYQITQGNLESFMDHANPHLIGVVDDREVAGSVCREKRIENKWSIRWNSGGASKMYSSVRELILLNPGYQFYFIQL